MDSFISSLEQYAKLFEECTMSQNPLAYIGSMPDSVEKKILQLITQEHTENCAEELKKLRKGDKYLWESLEAYKRGQKVMAAKEIKEIDYILKKMIKEKERQFKHTKPADYQAEEGGNEKEMAKLPSELKVPSDIKAWVEEKVETNQGELGNITEYGLLQMSEGALMKLKLKGKEQFLRRSNILKMYPPKFMAKFIKDFYNELRKMNKTYELESFVLNHLSIEQLEELKRQIPALNSHRTYLQMRFDYLFGVRFNKFLSSEMSLSLYDEKGNLLQEMIKEVKSIDTKRLKEFEDELEKQILVVDLLKKDVNQKLFLEFVEKNITTFSNEEQRKKLKGKKALTDQLHLSFTLESRNWNINTLVERCIEQLFRQNSERNIVERLKNYFEHERLEKMFAKVKLLQGQQVPDVQKILSMEELRELKEKKEITILEQTKKTFSVDDDLVLKMKCKNVSIINVKVYEINLEKRYLLEKREIDPNENLKFLNPNSITVHQRKNDNPFFEEIFDFQIPEKTKKRAVYIVELESEGISSRAFIRKGGIAFISKVITDGLQIKFYNEKGQQMKELELWFGDKKHAVKDSYTIPFGERHENHRICVVKDGYCEMISVSVPQESYNFRVGYIYGSESFIVGNKTKIILHPRLTLGSNNNVKMNLELLEDVKITVDMVNNQNIKSSLDFDNVKFSNYEDYVLEVPIQSYLKQIRINVQASIKKYSGDKVKFTSNKTIDIDLNENSLDFIDLYLKKKRDYCLYALGRNGEPISNLQAKVSYKMSGYQYIQEATLATTDKGYINLGQLQHVEKINVQINVKNRTLEREWILLESDLEVGYIFETVYKVGENISLPLSKKQENDPYYLIRRSQTGSSTKDYRKNCSIKNGRLNIVDLEEGYYELYWFRSSRMLEFSVIKGETWDKENQIYDKASRTISQIPSNKTHYMCLEEPQIKEEGDYAEISFAINKEDKEKIGQTLRVHLYASNFISSNLNNMFNINEFRNPEEIKMQSLSRNECQYFSNKILGQEASYVLNRGKEKKFMGNNLDKPKLFLKPIELRETDQLQEHLEVEKAYEDLAEAKYMSMGKEKMYAQKSGGARTKQTARMSMPGGPPAHIMKSLTTHNNFLSEAASMICNKKGEKITFKVPKCYSHFELFMLSDTNAIIKKFDKEEDLLPCKNLSHKGMVDENEKTGWTMSREVKSVNDKETVKVGRDSIWCGVSLSNIINFAMIKGYTLEDWVSNWLTYSHEKKKDVFDKKICHELNCYIYSHDKEFFNEVVRPHLTNKLVKTFVDFYLLEDDECLEWCKMEKFYLLNAFEKVLLVKRMGEKGRKEEGQMMAKMMRDQVANEKPSFEAFKAEFETVIYAKLVEKKREKVMKKQQMQKKDDDSDIEQQRFMLRNERAMEMQCAMQCDYEQQIEEEAYFSKGRENMVQGFKPTENTKEYAEKTYEGVKNAEDSTTLVSMSAFWAAAATHFIEKGEQPFLSHNFMFLRSKVDFTLASCFIPSNKHAEFDLANEEQNQVIQAKSPFLVFVKELKSVQYEKKFGVFLNQRFFNPFDKYYYEDDGTQIEKEVDEFIVKRPYCLQTLITNTSGTNLELQLLIDLPEGAFPLQSHEYTQIQNINLNAFSTLSFQRYFYFPKDGVYSLYPANACRVDMIIAKGERLDKMEVKTRETKRKMDSFENVLRSGNQDAIIKYLEEKNIFDSNIFDPYSILWMLRERKYYERVIPILRKRKFYEESIWVFGFLHKDLQTIQEYMKMDRNYIRTMQRKLPIFEYHPYYSNRVHKFLNENKSTIKNTQFKNNYYGLMFTALLNNDFSTPFKLAFVYYLLLQDRLDEAKQYYNQKITKAEKNQHKLQADYIQCFLDMSNGHPGFEKARKLIVQYQKYPVASWRKLFKDIQETLKEYDEATYEEEKVEVVYQPSFTKEGEKIRLNIPEKTSLEVMTYEINLQMYFSEFPFQPLDSFDSSIKPNHIKVYKEGKAREEALMREKGAKDIFVDMYYSVEKTKKKKLSGFLWSNPKLKVKVRESMGLVQVYYEGEKVKGCYCKVYQKKNGQNKFYRDGYTDITGTFKYALADLDGVSKFAVLVVTENGGTTLTVNPPSQQNFLV